MINRWGKSITVGWPEHHILWIEAAMTLPTRMERLSAYEDICDLTGRSLKAVMCKAAQMADEQRNASRRAAEARRMAERSRRWQEANLVS